MGLPGWNTFFGGIGALFGKASTYMPGRVEGLKNELAKLKKEKSDLEGGECDVKKSLRLTTVNKRIDDINSLLGNKATD